MDMGFIEWPQCSGDYPVVGREARHALWDEGPVAERY